MATLAALTVAGTAMATGESDEEQTTIKFVMRPDASVSTHDLPAALDALKSDSPLVQTVIGVLGSRVDAQTGRHRGRREARARLLGRVGARSRAAR